MFRPVSIKNALPFSDPERIAHLSESKPLYCGKILYLLNGKALLVAVINAALLPVVKYSLKITFTTW